MCVKYVALAFTSFRPKLFVLYVSAHGNRLRNPSHVMSKPEAPVYIRMSESRVFICWRFCNSWSLRITRLEWKLILWFVSLERSLVRALKNGVWLESRATKTVLKSSPLDFSSWLLNWCYMWWWRLNLKSLIISCFSKFLTINFIGCYIVVVIFY